MFKYLRNLLMLVCVVVGVCVISAKKIHTFTTNSVAIVTQVNNMIDSDLDFLN